MISQQGKEGKLLPGAGSKTAVSCMGTLLVGISPHLPHLPCSIHVEIPPEKAHFVTMHHIYFRIQHQTDTGNGLGWGSGGISFC